MTGFTIGCFFIVNLCLTAGCYLALSYANDSLFTYLGDAEITPGNWEACYSYDLLTFPARIVAFLFGVLAIVMFTVAWAAFIGVVFF